jgi:hypothetical protein
VKAKMKKEDVKELTMVRMRAEITDSWADPYLNTQMIFFAIFFFEFA